MSIYEPEAVLDTLKKSSRIYTRSRTEFQSGRTPIRTSTLAPTYSLNGSLMSSSMFPSLAHGSFRLAIFRSSSAQGKLRLRQKLRTCILSPLSIHSTSLS
ncbi:hypothetical protein CONPUDRAFT_85542 [Coniophora puteana RWD-64-598 SS2]|uniref:Uncharacterized protein n=1 Tax=Coniophora puteana (strain RWD-64-598) TaxID=741705 RepID=A0A5M3M7W1_CONPW|nr:uncharacterized protein CONPUDRAFT_85542 [Coniophora puteana RWD-64-598 SS2]EIW75318.1 hypothetical protein CONPUDRAFT_85542 [Coniophora puteana RWD-64-598 SS2]